jgi:YHS domain-containing protein
MAKDPVCGKEIDVEAVRSGGSRTAEGVAVVDPLQGTRSLHNGTWYYFCSIECRKDFMGTPEKYGGGEATYSRPYDRPSSS